MYYYFDIPIQEYEVKVVQYVLWSEQVVMSLFRILEGSIKEEITGQ